MENTQTSSPKIKLDFKDSKYATGRRKKSVAKVWLKKGSGQFYVNGKLLNDYFPRANHVMQILRPFEIINQPTDYDVRSKVVGGGQTGQAGALVHGISRALLKFDETLKSTLRKEKLIKGSVLAAYWHIMTYGLGNQVAWEIRWPMCSAGMS